MPMMTLRLSRQESARLASLSKKRRVTRSELVRKALALLDKSEPRSLLDDWVDAIGLVKKAPRDLSSNPRHLAGFGR
jgi:hypothetical protein